jgi:hypothetical protein
LRGVVRFDAFSAREPIPTPDADQAQDRLSLEGAIKQKGRHEAGLSVEFETDADQ